MDFGSEETLIEISNGQASSKGTRKRQSDPDAWKENVRKNTKNRSNRDIDFQMQERAQRKSQVYDCSKCRFKCSEHLKEETRTAFCEEFWQLRGYKRQKDILLSSVISNTI